MGWLSASSSSVSSIDIRVRRRRDDLATNFAAARSIREVGRSECRLPGTPRSCSKHRPNPWSGSASCWSNMPQTLGASLDKRHRVSSPVELNDAADSRIHCLNEPRGEDHGQDYRCGKPCSDLEQTHPLALVAVIALVYRKLQPPPARVFLCLQYEP